MPVNTSGVTESQLRAVMSGNNFLGFSPGVAQQYATQFPGLASELAPFLPATPATPAAPAATTPAATTPTTAAAVPNFLSSWDQINTLLQERQQEANVGRIPGAAGLEQQSSDIIAQLLNPPAMFADTNREAAELGAARGIGGSAAAATTGYRMTDEERLKRMALGQQMLSAAYARNPSAEFVNPLATYITPEQQARLDLARSAQNLEHEQWNWRVNRLNQPSVNYVSPEQFFGGSPGGYRSPTASMTTPGGVAQAMGGGITAEQAADALFSPTSFGWMPDAGGYDVPVGGWGQIGDEYYDFGFGLDSNAVGYGGEYDVPGGSDGANYYDDYQYWPEGY